MNELTENELKLLKILKENGDNPLTFLQMAGEVGVKSTNTISFYLKNLQNKGYLRMNPNNSRDYIVLKEPDETVSYLPVYALAKCGPEGLQNEDAVIDKVAISSKYLPRHSSSLVLVKAKGDSMIPKIQDNDFVIVERCEINQIDDAQIVVASTEERGTFIKQMRIDARTQEIIMISLNPKYSPFVVNSEDLNVFGIVRGTLFNYLTNYVN